jgi:hypothetical protein
MKIAIRAAHRPSQAADRKPARCAVKVDHPLFGAYSVADAFADSLRMAERLSSPAEAPRPEAILAVNAKVQVRVGGWILPAVADMLVIDDADERQPSVFVEVHDYELGALLWHGRWAHLRMIAAGTWSP